MFLPVNQRTDGLWQAATPLLADDSPPILRLAFMAAGSRPAAWLNDATASVSNSSQHSPSVAGHQLGHDVRDATHALLIRIPIRQLDDPRCKQARHPSLKHSLVFHRSHLSRSDPGA